MPFSDAPPFTTRPELRGTFGMAASTHWLATGTAQSVLERGGTAVDAAVAAAFVLHLVEPDLNGPGGDLTAILAPADADPIVVSGQGSAPAGASVDGYRAEGLEAVPGAGVLAAAVPGAVPAWLELLERYGTWELADVLAPALGYAREGHPLRPGAAGTIERCREVFETHWPTSAERWLPGGRGPGEHDLVTDDTWAGLLERMLGAGDPDGTREERIRSALTVWTTEVGSAAEAFVSHPGFHADGRNHAGVLTAEDLAAHRTLWEAPASIEFRGTRVAKAGPWTQGPVLLQTLAILDGMPDERLDPSTALGIHTIVEAMKLAFADRDSWYGDRDDVPLADLLNPGYARERAALIGETASTEYRPGRPGGREPWIPPLRVPSDGGAGTGEPTLDEPPSASPVDDPQSGVPRGDTCHLDVIDRFGTMVSATPSGGWLQSSPTIPELGFCLGTRLQMTWLDEASPSALRAGARPRSTLSPTVLLRDGRVVEALGTPGGDGQDQWQTLYLLRRLVGGWSPQAAIDAPAFLVEGIVDSFDPRTFDPASLRVEDRVGAGVVDELRARGHRVTVVPAWSLGRLSAVGLHPAGGFFAASNPRGGAGYASGR